MNQIKIRSKNVIYLIVNFEMTRNKYDVGIWGNIKEVLFPPVKTPSAFALPWDALKAKRP